MLWLKRSNIRILVAKNIRLTSLKSNEAPL